MASKVYFRPECGREDRIGHDYGPFEFLQITYSELRIAPNGETVMYRGADGGAWKFLDLIVMKSKFKPHVDDALKVWSDIVIYSE